MLEVLFNKQRYEFFSKSQHTRLVQGKNVWCCSISKDTNFSANHNYGISLDEFKEGVVQ